MVKSRESLKSNGERYEVAVTWKTDRPTVANNYEMALSRLQNTEKRLSRRENLGDDYNAIIQSYESKGYIHEVSQAEEMKPEGQVWFLPHFPVCRPEKAMTKTRIVFDASAKYRGISLNDMISPGSNLQKFVQCSNAIPALSRCLSVRYPINVFTNQDSC